MHDEGDKKPFEEGRKDAPEARIVVAQPFDGTEAVVCGLFGRAGGEVAVDIAAAALEIVLKW